VRKKIFDRLLAVCMLLLTQISITKAQFSGGAGTGTVAAFKTSLSIGQNVFRGGTDDGTYLAFTSGASLGRNIFKGGNDDGINVSIAPNQPMGRNIFLGGKDDGFDVSVLPGQPLGVNIFKGGKDDGTSVAAAQTQFLGMNIFAGGPDDGWARGFQTGPQYTFIGNGNWDISTNWFNNAIPPVSFTAGEIIINPVTGGECFLNRPQFISNGSKLRVVAGKKLRIPANLTIQ
jgi:hypothetical protein